MNHGPLGGKTGATPAVAPAPTAGPVAATSSRTAEGPIDSAATYKDRERFAGRHRESRLDISAQSTYALDRGRNGGRGLPTLPPQPSTVTTVTFPGTMNDCCEPVKSNVVDPLTVSVKFWPADLDVRGAVRTGAGDDVGEAVAGDVPQCGPHTAAERLFVCEKARIAAGRVHDANHRLRAAGRGHHHLRVPHGRQQRREYQPGRTDVPAPMTLNPL